MSVNVPDAPRRVWLPPILARECDTNDGPADVEYVRADVALSRVAEMLEKASREVILPPADTAGIVQRAEKSYGYWAAARYLRTLQGGQEK